MDIKEFLDKVCQEVKYKPVRREIAEELGGHINDIKENYIDDGITEKEAEQKAILQMGIAEEIGKKLNKIHRPKLDWKLLLIVIILILFGGLVETIRINNVLENNGIIKEIVRYIIFLIFGIIPSIIIYFLDYRKLKKYSNAIYIIATLIICLTLLLGKNINGKPYLYFNILTIAPEVIALPLYIIAFAGFINDFDKESKIKSIISKNNRKKSNKNSNLIKIIFLSCISLMALMIIPSFASVFILTLVYLTIATIKIIQSKRNRIKNLIKLWGIIFIGFLFLSIYIIGVSPYRIQRINVAFNPEEDPQGSGWVAMNRKVIIENAKLFGESENTSYAIKLFDEGTNHAFISIIAHHGWIIGILIVTTIILFSIKLILNAINIKEIYGKFLVIGLSSMFILQSIFNILVNLNLWIDTTLNLPFVSYGIGNLIVNAISLSIILSVYRRKNINKYDENKKQELEYTKLNET